MSDSADLLLIARAIALLGVVIITLGCLWQHQVPPIGTIASMGCAVMFIAIAARMPGP